MQNIIRTILFAFFFSSGAASIGGSILCDDLVQYYRNRQLLKAAQQYLDRLKSLNTDYDGLLRRLETDPNLVKRIAPAALGTEPQDANTIYPRATARQLAAARKALAEAPSPLAGNQTELTMPTWLGRLREPRRRIVLFFAGAGLILISFICFAPAVDKPQKSP